MIRQNGAAFYMDHTGLFEHSLTSHETKLVGFVTLKTPPLRSETRRGVQDVRAVSFENKLYAVGCSYEYSTRGNRIRDSFIADFSLGDISFENIRTLPYANPKSQEKNWIPV